jgi:hypothetical protein
MAVFYSGEATKALSSEANDGVVLPRARCASEDRAALSGAIWAEGREQRHPAATGCLCDLWRGRDSPLVAILTLWPFTGNKRCDAQAHCTGRVVRTLRYGM